MIRRFQQNYTKRFQSLLKCAAEVPNCSGSEFAVSKNCWQQPPRGAKRGLEAAQRSTTSTDLLNCGAHRDPVRSHHTSVNWRRETHLLAFATVDRSSAVCVCACVCVLGLKKSTFSDIDAQFQT